MGIWKTYLRWRHSKGFGVHSPYAYGFVTNVLRPGDYGYYSYDEIFQHLKGKEHHDTSFLRLVKFIIRLAVFLKAERLVTVGKKKREAEVAARALNCKIEAACNQQFQFREGDLLILEGSTLKNIPGLLELLENAKDKGVPIFALQPETEVREKLEAPISRGLLLNGGKKMILIPRQEMEFVAYDIKLFER